MSQAALGQTNEPILHRLQPPLVAAHRGGEFGRPNTLVQFAKALDTRDADILEMDLQLTSDGKVVVFHDDVLDQKSDCTGKVADRTYNQLLDCKLTNGERIALFSDVLAVVEGRRLISAELKTDQVALPATRLILAANAINWVYFQVQSSHRRYQLVRAASPYVAMMIKADTPASVEWILAAKDPYLKIVGIGRDDISPSLVRELHAQQKLVSLDTWRYQFTEERFVASCDRAFEQGVDIAVTNNPASCHLQRDFWASQRIDPGHFYDRQHVRVWFRTHSQSIHGLPFVPMSLALAAVVAIRRRKRRFRLANPV